MPPVIDLPAIRRQLQPGGEPPDNGDMETRLNTLEKAVKELPTKADFAGLRADFDKLRADMNKTSGEARSELGKGVGDVRTELAKGMGDVRTELAKNFGEVRADLHKNSVDIQRWMIATVIGLFLGFGGLFLAMSNALKPTTQQAPTAAVATPSPPIVINVPPLSNSVNK